MAFIDARKSANPDAVVISKSTDWIFDGKNLISYEPNTWIERQDWMAREILAVLSCPNCHVVTILHSNVHKIDNKGCVSPDIQCFGGNCSFHRKVYLDYWGKLPLYACAVEILTKRGREPRIMYTHASDIKQAMFMLGPRIDGCHYDVVAIGPAIGYLVADGKDDSKLVGDTTQVKSS